VDAARLQRQPCMGSDVAVGRRGSALSQRQDIARKHSCIPWLLQLLQGTDEFTQHVSVGCLQFLANSEDLRELIISRGYGDKVRLVVSCLFSPSPACSSQLHPHATSGSWVCSRVGPWVCSRVALACAVEWLLRVLSSGSCLCSRVALSVPARDQSAALRQGGCNPTHIVPWEQAALLQRATTPTAGRHYAPALELTGLV